MGGQASSFGETRWTLIRDARSTDATARQVALEQLSKIYWKPVYASLRRRGYGNEEAKDLTQGFFRDVILGRDLAGKADPARGKFRTFMLTALDNYVRSARRAERAQKRMPAEEMFPLDNFGEHGSIPEPSEGATPEQAFHHTWASALVDEVLAKVKAECAKKGQETYWQVFAARVLDPIMENAPGPSLSDLCSGLGICDEATASNMVITVKRRFQSTLKRHIAQFASSDEEVEEEICDLMAALSREHAG